MGSNSRSKYGSVSPATASPGSSGLSACSADGRRTFTRSMTRSSTSAASSSVWTKSPAGHCRVLLLDPQAASALLTPATTHLLSRLRRKLRRCSGQSPTQFELAEYHFYGALARAAHCDSASADERCRAFGSAGRLITSSSRSGRRIARQLSRIARRWSAPRSRASKAASSMPMRLYEAGHPARRATTALSRTRRLANELAARFYAARGFETIADAYLRNARYCYLRWGADGKVRQLDELYPHLERRSQRPVRRARSGRPSNSSISRPSSKSRKQSRARWCWKSSSTRSCARPSSMPAPSEA